MGHYASEMADFDPGPQKPRKKLGIDEKPIHGDHTNGSMTEETVVTQYVAEYDVYDWDYQYHRKEKNDPENWQFRRYRAELHRFGDRTDEDLIKRGEELIRSMGDQDRTNRPGKIMRRTVTYGPWEVIGETDEHTEGWY